MRKMLVFTLFLICPCIFSIYSKDIQIEDLSDNEKLIYYKIEQARHNFDRDLTVANKNIDELKGILSCGENWIPYLGEKCFIIIDELVTELEAEKSCQKLDKSSTLVGIHSQEESKFLTDLLSEKSSLSDNIWIGLKYIVNDTYEWLDNSEVSFSNWEPDAIADGSLPCVQMSLERSSLGKWRDEECERKSLTVCQRYPQTVQALQNDLDEVIKNINQHDAIINDYTQHNNVPVGYIYTQYPKDPEPAQLWPKTMWKDISDEYSELFFRVEGGESLNFGEIQEQNYSSISDIRTYSICQFKYSGTDGENQIKIDAGAWSADIVNINGKTFTALNKFELFKTPTINVPDHIEIKIWIRTE